MINDSQLWKEDLLKSADKLELRLVQKRWGAKSVHTFEKQVFFGFYAIRKLIESKKVSASAASKTIDIFEFPRATMVDPILPFCYEGEFDFSQGKKILVSTFALCNQFIHSHYFVPFIPGGKGLFGVFVCSDFKRKTGIYFISTFDMVAIFRLVGGDTVRSKTYERMPNGEVKVKVE